MGLNLSRPAAIKGRTGTIPNQLATALKETQSVTPPSPPCSSRSGRLALARFVIAASAGALAALATLGAAAHGKLTLAPVVEEVSPAVVNIQITCERPRRHPFFSDEDLRRYFPDRRVCGVGAGFITDAEAGHIVTNHHVVDDAAEITVILQDRRQFTAEVVGSDRETDLALIRIEAEDLTAATLGDSDALAVGDFVIAIGNPFGYDYTVTSGIVSALGRGGFIRDGYEDFIQTDAAINRGNSGGPLVDVDGNVVGVNSVIYTPSGVSAGLGFAVPSNIVKVVAAQLLEYGEARRGQLGVLIANLSAEDAEALGLDKAAGVVVSEVVPDSAAEGAGLEPGDAIVSLDGKAVVDVRDLRARVGLTPIGQEVALGIVRDGDEQTLAATIGGAGGDRDFPAVRLLAGIECRDLPRAHPRYGEGVEVAAVESGSRGGRAGLRRGDIVLRVNQRRVGSVEELRGALADREVAGLLLERDGRRAFLIIR